MRGLSCGKRAMPILLTLGRILIKYFIILINCSTLIKKKYKKNQMQGTAIHLEKEVMKF